MMRRRRFTATALVVALAAVSAWSAGALAFSPPPHPGPPADIAVETGSGRQVFVEFWPLLRTASAPRTVTIRAGELVRFDLSGLHRIPDAVALTVGGTHLLLTPDAATWRALGPGGPAVLTTRFNDTLASYEFFFIANLVIEPDFTPLCAGWRARVDRLADRLTALRTPAARSAAPARVRIRALIVRLRASQRGFGDLIAGNCAPATAA
jgi:hypothetical protein